MFACATQPVSLRVLLNPRQTNVLCASGEGIATVANMSTCPQAGLRPVIPAGSAEQCFDRLRQSLRMAQRMLHGAAHSFCLKIALRKQCVAAGEGLGELLGGLRVFERRGA